MRRVRALAAPSAFGMVGTNQRRPLSTVRPRDWRRQTTPGTDGRTLLRQPTLPFRATPPSTSSVEARSPSLSPSFAAVTAGPSRGTTTSTAARSTAASRAAPNRTTAITAAKQSGDAAETRMPPTTATVSGPRVVSVQRIRLPDNQLQRIGVRSNTSTRAPSRPPQITPPIAGATRTRCGEGATRKLPARTSPPVSARTRRATSVPIEHREGTARRERVSPHPPPLVNLSSSDSEEGTPRNIGGAGRQRRKMTAPPPSDTTTHPRRSSLSPYFHFFRYYNFLTSSLNFHSLLYHLRPTGPPPSIYIFEIHVLNKIILKTSEC
ncbi:hypothetical protein ALC62_13456 [Cyphomyrmex costatus]|uniref:Uncharacterized protein n=1 Tax=Cyphomyrmex costatus TaxID=456900 RepID=A0A151IA42_9HYME|nr:hypothetical protein ALC62_13456 [Cyphomyrmex costatus]